MQGKFRVNPNPGRQLRVFDQNRIDRPRIDKRVHEANLSGCIKYFFFINYDCNLQNCLNFIMG